MRKNKAAIVCVLIAFIFTVLAFVGSIPEIEEEIKLKNLKEEVTEEYTTPDDPEKGIDWIKLKKINPDIIAWIRVPGTAIDHPVLKNQSPNYYLNHDYTGTRSVLGSVFVQPDTDEKFADQHIVIYGHNVSQMFGDLHKYENEDFFRKNQQVWIYTPEQTMQGTIYSTYACFDTTTTYQTRFDSMEEWKDWKEQSMKQSSFDGKEIPGDESRIVTLSTCYGKGQSKMLRYVVHLVLI